MLKLIFKVSVQSNGFHSGICIHTGHCSLFLPNPHPSLSLPSSFPSCFLSLLPPRPFCLLYLPSAILLLSFLQTPVSLLSVPRPTHSVTFRFLVPSFLKISHLLFCSLSIFIRIWSSACSVFLVIKMETPGPLELTLYEGEMVYQHAEQ